MSSAIIKFEDDPKKMIYWKDHAYPAGLGFKLVDFYEYKCDDLFANTSDFEMVSKIPKDIQYEYIVKSDHTIHCQECWYTADKNYHGGGFRYGGVYDLKKWQEKIRLQNLYTYRRPEAWMNH